jgi:catechol 2,3-dioxygenase-like lactoylglutathione lyase family enzyme
VITGFRRLTLAAHDPSAAARAYAQFLGRPLASAGATITLGNVSLELREAPPGAEEGVARVTFAVDDLAETRRMLGRRALATREDGEGALVDASASHGVEIALAPTVDGGPPTGGADAIDGLDHLVIRTSDPERAIALYGSRLGLDFRLDRTNPAWGARLMFFRCGDAVVEVSADPDAPRSDAPDRSSGLAWRARDPAAVHARLSAQGVDVSPLRSGRKPGTQVFTLRSGLPAAPALVIGAQH